MRPFSLLVKPVGADCNLNCPYCFYRDKPVGRMRDETLARMLETYAALPFAGHAVCFQGGEPTLMGEGFFRRAAALAPHVAFSVQTNATRVTDALARFFAEAGWLIGASPHDADCVAGLRRLQAAGAEVNVLQLVTRDNVGEPERLYHRLRDDLGSRHHQYIECTAPAAFAVDGASWGDFLVRLFDEWLRCGDAHRVSVRLFDALVSELAFGRADLCAMADDCRQYLVVDFAGDVYPCDFYVEPEWRLGNVFTDAWDALLASPKYAAFGMRHRGRPDCPRNGGMLDAAYACFRAHARPVLQRLLEEMR